MALFWMIADQLLFFVIIIMHTVVYATSNTQINRMFDV